MGCHGQGTWENSLGTPGTLVLLSLKCRAVEGANCPSQFGKRAEGTLGFQPGVAKCRWVRRGALWGTVCALSPSPQVDMELPGPAWSSVCWVTWPTPASRAGSSGRQQQLDKLLELLPVLIDVDLRLPEGIDQHRITDLIQHDVCS